MRVFEYHHRFLWVESVNIKDIIHCFGTPVYIYSRAAIEFNWQCIQQAFQAALLSPIVAYAVKANSHLAILNILVKKGASFDVVSIGELHRVLKAGGDPKKIFFSGVGKSTQEITEAIQLSIGCLHVESMAELARIEQLAALLDVPHHSVPIALRINPDVNPKTHPYIATGLKENKFGIALAQAKQLYQQRAQYPHLNFMGIACHIGSQILQLDPYIEALQSLLALYDELVIDGLVLSHIDLGGGFGITYTNEKPFDIVMLAQAIAQAVGDRPLKIMIEPGRSIVGNAGILVTKVEYLKNNEDKHFAIVDAGMNDLLRPALYQASHPIWPIKQCDPVDTDMTYYDIVGPVCETGDFLAKNQPLSSQLSSGDYLAVGMVGAYGFAMSSHYNTRPKPAEVLIDGSTMHLIRQRETLEDILRGEMMLAG